MVVAGIISTGTPPILERTRGARAQFCRACEHSVVEQELFTLVKKGVSSLRSHPFLEESTTLLCVFRDGLSNPDAVSSAHMYF